MNESNERKKSAVGGAIKGMFRAKRDSLLVPRRASDDSDSRTNSTLVQDRWNSKSDHSGNNLHSSTSRTNSDNNWDLKSCIETLESLLHDDNISLSEEHKVAIDNLRSASSMSQSKRTSKVKFGNSLMKRFSSGEKQTHKSSMARQKFVFMTKEMRETWIEVAADQEDKDRQQCVHDVLEVYGGGRFDKAWGSRGQVPNSMKKGFFRKVSETIGSCLLNPRLSHFFRHEYKFLTCPHKSSMARQKFVFMTKEMRETWIEVAADQEDKDRQQCVHDVLEVYGGGRFDKAWGSRGQVPNSMKKVSSGKSVRRSAAASPKISTLLQTFKGDSILALAASMVANGMYNYCPPEWNRLRQDAKTELTQMLSLKNLSKWEFDVIKMADLTRTTLTPEDKCNNDEDEESSSSKNVGGEQFCPLLFVGWAILCAPMAQNAMEGSLEGYSNTRDPGPSSKSNSDSLVNNISSSDTGGFHYNFDDHLKINPEAICNFLREIERRYSHDNPYHNNTHAADVTQTLHCLLSLIGKDLLYSISKPLEIFSLILAATFHDVGHPGTNNLFHKNAMTHFAMQYNDVSILENMHTTVGHTILMGEERKDQWDVFQNWKQSQIVEARDIMIRAILGTDMSNHFFKMDELMEKIESVRFTANIVLQSELGEEAEDEFLRSSRRSRDEKDQQQMLDILGSLPGTIKLSRDDGNTSQQQILDILAKVRDKSLGDWKICILPWEIPY